MANHRIVRDEKGRAVGGSWVCSCGEVDPTKFYGHNRLFCKACVIKRERERYKEKRDEIVVKARKQYSARADRVKATHRAYRARNPEKMLARQRLANAIRRGEIVRGPCEVCGNPKTHGHHEDYSRALDVRWLCRKHHREAHGQKPWD